mmetsp:Transcript_69571/g.193591  ORF Transcript_69571/g.193591 Transcript_69571/m.193591 type:complete len:97 (+) Transcript_69571:57-347(+)
MNSCPRKGLGVASYGPPPSVQWGRTRPQTAAGAWLLQLSKAGNVSRLRHVLLASPLRRRLGDSAGHEREDRNVEMAPEARSRLFGKKSTVAPPRSW